MIIESIKALREHLNGKTSVGFVPTMGYLHEGHLSLIAKSKKENQLTVVSIFVNPTQFAPGEDFETYPRDLDRDYNLAVSAGADVIFHPSVEEMYIPGSSTNVTVEGDITKKLCGASRPTHFKGVTTVVNTLFNIVKPHRAYFGQKDAQQAIIIKKMVRDLHMDVNVIVCPIIRESDGLAMSSRNTYLSKDERSQALVLSQGLKSASEAYDNGENDVTKLKKHIRDTIEAAPLARIDYIEILDGHDLSEITTASDNTLMAVAVFFGKTRLIDNVLL